MIPNWSIYFSVFESIVGTNRQSIAPDSQVIGPRGVRSASILFPDESARDIRDAVATSPIPMGGPYHEIRAFPVTKRFPAQKMDMASAKETRSIQVLGVKKSRVRGRKNTGRTTRHAHKSVFPMVFAV
jgi:hypothetical protein